MSASGVRRGAVSEDLSTFGRSGDLRDLYEHHGIDPETIVGADLDITG